MELAALALLPLVAPLLGVLLLWSVQIVRAYSNIDTTRALWSFLLAVGWVLLIVGICALIVVTSHIVLVVALLVIFIGTLLFALRRYRAAERQSLLWILTVAAERGFPMDSAARAFAAERQGAIGARAEALAEYLEAGVPLELALMRSRQPLPYGALLAAEMGRRTNNLGEGFRQLTQQNETFDSVIRGTLERIFYLSFVAIVGFLVLMFFMLQIMPVFAHMFDEFGMELPWATRQLVAWSDFAVTTWMFVPFYAFLGCVLLVGSLHYLGVSARHLPGMRLIWWRTDCATIMRWLAVCIRQGRPIAETLSLLAKTWRHLPIRSRLALATRYIEGGTHWCDSMRKCNLVRGQESAIFKAAERAGNLEWALTEMADSSVRRSAYRMTALVNLIFPIIVLGMGVAVSFIAIGTLTVLFDLTMGLS